MRHRPISTLDRHDRNAALEALSTDQRKRLAAYANLCSAGLPDEGCDLLQSAYQRWLASDVPIEGPVETEKYLFGAIKSIRFNGFRRKRAEAKALGGRIEPDLEDGEAEPPVEMVAGSESNAEDATFAQQLYDALNDPELKLLVLHLAERTPRKQIQAELGWDDKKYDAVQKRKLRTVAKLLKEGKI